MTDTPITHVALVSLGCPKNLVDSESMLAALAEAGCVVGAPMEEADVIVINTCGFLSAARDESHDVIAEALEHKRIGRTRRVVVAGCLPSRDGETIREATSGIDAIVGVNDRERIAEAVLGEGQFTAVREHPDRYLATSRGDAGRFRLTAPHTAYIRIAEGCDQKCTFCTIPAIRGPYRSKPAELVLREATELIESGATELNLIAQDTTYWGCEKEAATESKTLADLLRQLDALPGVNWLRLLYTYPRGFDESLIAAISECDHVIPYLDMPLQHIATPVLRRMGRRVTREETITLLETLVDRIPGLALRTSFIVGFPGETDADFAELLDFVETFSFDAVGVFEFSPEPGTPAALLPDQVPAEIVAERAKTLMAAQQNVVFESNQALVGQPLEVLVDGIDSEGQCVGRYYGQAPDIDACCLLTEPKPAGTIVPATIVDWKDYDLIVTPN